MNRLDSLKLRKRLGPGLALMAVVYAVSIALITAEEPKAAKNTKPEKKEKTTEKRKGLTGQELYAVHCSRCHAERYPTEFTASQWKTIAFEMRVRANLPASEAKAILKYLQEDSGNP